MIDPKSIEIYSMTPEREEKLWKDCIFVFDTSALLNFYDYSPETQNSIFQKIFPKLINRLWIPKQVEYEYLKNRQDTMRKHLQKYEKILLTETTNNDGGYFQKIEASIQKIKKEIKYILGQIQTLEQSTKKQETHPYFDDKSLIKDLESNFATTFEESITSQIKLFEDRLNECKEKVQKEKSNREEEVKKISQNDPVLKKISDFFEVGQGYSFDKLMEIVKEGELRYRAQIPPGYKDDKPGISLYGDLILWKQIIDYAKIKKKHIILVINDITKGDWCDTEENDSKKIDKPREELIKELYDITGIELWMYSFSQFLYKARKILDVKLDQKILDNVEEIERENPNEKEKEKLIVLCQGELDAIILKTLSERILRKFQINKEIDVLNAGEIYNIFNQIEDYLKLSNLDSSNISDIIVVIDGNENQLLIRYEYEILSKGIKDSNLIIIHPCIERWLLSNLDDLLKNSEDAKIKIKKLLFKIRDLYRSGTLDLLLQAIDIEEIMERDSSFAKYVNALIR
ncbi:MAG TPA: PIN-like domain-containing protein [Nostocaceae cyanobacterium]|nr:PIN-like domain-containing protein [Nostocaceae cyanobacterium]